LFSNHCLASFARYCTLNVLGMLALSCYVLADTFFVANGLGANGLAALNLAIPVYSLIHGCGLLLGMGGATRYSIHLHQGNSQMGCAAFTHTLVGGGLLVLFFICLGLFWADSITRFMGADPVVFSMTRTYIRVLLLFSPAYLLNDILLCFVRNDGSPQRAMAAMVTGSLANIVLDYIFIFPLQMGIFGAVLATGFAPIISITVLSPFFLRRENHFHPISCSPSLALTGAIAGTGLPSLVTEVSSGVVMIAFNQIILGLQGNLGVAAYGVVANLSLVVLSIYTGVAQGVQPLFSRYFGTDQSKLLRDTLRYGIFTVLILSVFLYGILFLWADPISALFNRDCNPLLQTTAVEGLKLYFLACPFAGWNILLSVWFSSTDVPRPAHIISLLRGFFLILPLAFFLSALGGITGLWLTFPATEALVALLGIFLLLRCKKIPAVL